MNKIFNSIIISIVFLNIFITAQTEKKQEIIKYQDADLVAFIQKTPCLGDCPHYSIRVYGDGRIVKAGETVHAKKIPANQKEIQSKIKRFMQRAEEIDFLAIYEKTNENPAPIVDDGVTTSTGVWLNGVYRQINCSSNSQCPKEIAELHRYFVELFCDEINRKN